MNYKLVIGKLLAKIADNEQATEAITKLLDPYKGNVIYSKMDIIKRLIERYKAVFGNGAQATTPTS